MTDEINTRWSAAQEVNVAGSGRVAILDRSMVKVMSPLSWSAPTSLSTGTDDNRARAVQVLWLRRVQPTGSGTKRWTWLM